MREQSEGVRKYGMKAVNKKEREWKKLLEVVKLTKGERTKRRRYEMKKGDKRRKEKKKGEIKKEWKRKENEKERTKNCVEKARRRKREEKIRG